MTVDPDIIIGRPPATRRPLLAELGRRDRAVAAVLSLVARGRSVEAAVDSVRAAGRAVGLDDVLVAVGVSPDRPPAPQQHNERSVRFVDEAWTSLSAGQRCVLRRPPDPGRRHA